MKHFFNFMRKSLVLMGILTGIFFAVPGHTSVEASIKDGFSLSNYNYGELNYNISGYKFTVKNYREEMTYQKGKSGKQYTIKGWDFYFYNQKIYCLYKDALWETDLQTHKKTELCKVKKTASLCGISKSNVYINNSYKNCSIADKSLTIYSLAKHKIISTTSTKEITKGIENFRIFFEDADQGQVYFFAEIAGNSHYNEFALCAYDSLHKKSKVIAKHVYGVSVVGEKLYYAKTIRYDGKGTLKFGLYSSKLDGTGKKKLKEYTIKNCEFVDVLIHKNRIMISPCVYDEDKKMVVEGMGKISWKRDQNIKYDISTGESSITNEDWGEKKSSRTVRKLFW